MAKRARKREGLNILFIGNSFTARNDLPGLVGRVAASRGKSVRHDLIHAGGASLRVHWNAGKALKAIRKGRDDYVVLQEQSTLPVKNAGRMQENVRLFDEAIKAAGSKTALYMTWARQHAPLSQRAITDAYTNIGRELGATVIPVGLAWEDYLGESEGPPLHDRDGSHPNLAGSYLAACVFIGSLFGEDPVGYDGEVDGLEKEQRVMLQKAAWRACKAVVKRRRAGR